MEYRKRCNVCGHIFCYTDKDVKESDKNKIISGISDLGAAAGAFGGHWGATLANQNNANRFENKIKDFNRCPKCNSTDLTLLSDEEWANHLKRQQIADRGGISINTNASEEALINRIEIFMEEGDWITAEMYSDQVLDMNPKNAYVYFLRILINNHVQNAEQVIAQRLNLAADKNFTYVQRYGDSDLLDKIKDIQDAIQRSIDEERLKSVIEQINKYSHIALDSSQSSKSIESAIAELNAFKEKGHTSLDETLRKAQDLLILKKEQEEEQKKENAKTKKKRNSLLGIIAVTLLIVTAIGLYFTKVVLPGKKYNEAIRLMDNEEYEAAASIFEKLNGYSDSNAQLIVCKRGILYFSALDDIRNGEYSSAYEKLRDAHGFKDANELVNNFYHLPTAIHYTDLIDYTFNYDESGKMTNASAEYGNGNDWSYSFDSAGKLISVVAPSSGKTERGSYTYKGNSISLQFSISEYTYDAYGNYYYKTPKKLDQYNNTIAPGKTNVYSPDGLLERVDSSSGDNSTVDYKVIYNENTVDMELVWKNVRLVISDRVWY